MPLKEHDFLGLEAEQTRQKILQKYSDIFALLKDLNDVCHEYLDQGRFNGHNPVEVLAIAYFIRGLMTFQSLIMLLERGCIEDACALCRTLLQGYYRIAAIAANPTVINRIFATGVNDQKRRLEFYKSGRLKLPANVTNIDLDAKIAEAEAEIKKLGGSMTNDYELAEIGGCQGDYSAYLLMSDAAHTSPSDLRSFLKFDRNGHFLGYNYGPHDRELASYAGYILVLQRDNLINANKVIKGTLPTRLADLESRSINLRSDMPGVFNPQK
jgi:hypothetical protein